MISSFTLISLIGVLLGVLVLLVVMAVYAGLEHNMKNRLLGFTPHVLMVEQGPGQDWQEVAGEVEKLPGVVSANGYISDYVILDVPDVEQKPVLYSAVDTTDTKQVAGIQKMLDLKDYPDSTADMGIDDRVVISQLLARSLGLQVGDSVSLISARNLKETVRVYKNTDQPAMREAFPELWGEVERVLSNGWQPDGEAFLLSSADYKAAYSAMLALVEKPIRENEQEWLNETMLAMDESEKVEATQVFHFSAEQKQAALEPFAKLRDTDVDQMDVKALRGMKNAVVPKDVTIVGIYQASMMVATPDVFLPLPLAQHLYGLEDGNVQGIAVRLQDPYQAYAFLDRFAGKFSDAWYFEPWGLKYGQFFNLINQQRVMMYFTLSFIVLISAFSMMAVMFTVTIQKRREIGVMKALGAAPGQIVRVFLYQGMLLGVLGSLLGVGLGHLVLHYRGVLQKGLRVFGFDPFDSSLIGSDVLPVHHNPSEQVGIALLGFVLCSLAALVPAFFAARSDAAKSLRNL